MNVCVGKMRFATSGSGKRIVFFHNLSVICVA